MRQRTFASILVVIGLLLLVVLPVAWRLTRPESVLGNVAAVESALRDTDSAVLPADEPDRSPAVTTPAAPSEDGGPSEGAGPESEAGDGSQVDLVGLPVALRIDEIAVDAPIEPYGVDPRSGDMDVPDNVTDVAWYEFGPRPGESGSAVLAAHVDLASQGAGVFFELASLEPGDRVVVTYGDGREVAFRVSARAEYRKDELPLDVIFSREGPSVLTLITCGGGFNRQIQRYDSNIVVYAVPDDGSLPVQQR